MTVPEECLIYKCKSPKNFMYLHLFKFSSKHLLHKNLKSQPSATSQKKESEIGNK